MIDTTAQSLQLTRRALLRAGAHSALVKALTASPFALTLGAMSAASAQAANDYRALVCVFLYGGMDQHNTIIPFDSASYQAYRNSRKSVARPLDQLTALTPKVAFSGTNAGLAFALPPELAALKPYWDRGQLAVVANVGPLVVPTTKAQFFAESVPLPPKLFSHNDQQYIWQSNAPEGSLVGWGGRIAELITAQNKTATYSAVSYAGNAVFLAGEKTRGASLRGLTNIAGSRFPAFGYPADSVAKVRDLFDAQTANAPSVFSRDYAQMAQRSGLIKAELDAASQSLPQIGLPSGTSEFGFQLYEVLQMIAARNELGLKRQVFFVSMGGFDTHGSQSGILARLHRELASSLTYFQTQLEALGVANNVTTFTASDFGRSLSDNGDGTDHGWGGHHLVLGGAVRGQQFYGTFPELALGGRDDVGNGQLIPTTAVDQYGATLARWLGVSVSDLPLVFPSISRFASSNLGFMA